MFQLQKASAKVKKYPKGNQEYMSKLEVLIATMNQTDFSLLEKMNIQSDAVIANQGNENKYEECEYCGHKVKMITTTTRGVGLNRNIALLYSSADILLFADDDVIYNDGYAENIIKAFEEKPKAQAMIFGLAYSKNGEIYSTVRLKNKRVRVHNSLKHGAARLAIRREIYLKKYLSFSQLFGGGCLYSSGEDSLFILSMLKRKCKVYTDSYVLGKTEKKTSSWFQGYNDKFFYDKGAWLEAAFPKRKNIMKWYFVFRFIKMTNLSPNQIRKLINSGIKGFKSLSTYQTAHPKR